LFWLFPGCNLPTTQSDETEGQPDGDHLRRHAIPFQSVNTHAITIQVNFEIQKHCGYAVILAGSSLPARIT
jgi:hypothetical protein